MDGFRKGKIGLSISKRDPPPGHGHATGGAGGEWEGAAHYLM